MRNVAGKRTFPAVLVAATLLASGCMEDPTQRVGLVAAERSTLDAVALCCDRYSALPYAPLPPGKRIRYRHDARLPAFEIAGTKSYVGAFELAEIERARAISITTYLDRVSPLTGKGVLAYPSLLFLDERYEPVLTMRAPPLHYERPTAADPAALSATLALPEAARAARYLIVFVAPSDKPTTGICTSLRTRTRLDANGLPYATASSSDCEDVPLAVEGDFAIELVR